ncbi:twin-arginine translocase TatA/TatE family subunit [Paenibacillus albiflavus]|uniref:Sec-independent protein translocase protein TatA n=1 Tax=Paenibacillus albiflavus TaxID=2545760 RepID=A0A4R4E3Z1_9BACL|nr:twin-arginine translocase TatA/TatE family subunit [Paenibacillus albiflavus]TCZ74266.1 twin-arginine translocase TatA/TatE family subunit [Paenibacillus albiflavus]
MGLSPWHILIVVLVALLLFGPNKLPELGRSFGRMFKEFKNATAGITSDEADKAKPVEAARTEELQVNNNSSK